jgi:hypothetical protein
MIDKSITEDLKQDPLMKFLTYYINERNTYFPNCSSKPHSLADTCPTFDLSLDQIPYFFYQPKLTVKENYQEGNSSMN